MIQTQKEAPRHTIAPGPQYPVGYLPSPILRRLSQKVKQARRRRARHRLVRQVLAILVLIAAFVAIIGIAISRDAQIGHIDSHYESGIAEVYYGN